jgi:hypothetical protein
MRGKRKQSRRAALHFMGKQKIAGTIWRFGG